MGIETSSALNDAESAENEFKSNILKDNTEVLQAPA